MKRVAVIRDPWNFWKVYKEQLEKHSIEVETFDIFSNQDQKKLLANDWDGFFYRAGHTPTIRKLSKTFLYFFDKTLNVKTFPAWDYYWLYDDKVAQSILFEKLNIPSPKTFVFNNKDEALDFISNKTEFPLVYKASSGAGSSNVGLVKNKLQAKNYIRKAFGKGIQTHFKEDLQRGYVYFQEYLKNNNGDYRIICISDKRILGFFRENRPNAKFASGSGIYNYRELPIDLLEFVSKVHKKLNFPIWMSYDIMKDNNDNWVIGEVSVLNGDLDSAEVYRQSHHYLLADGKFIESESTIDVHEFFISNLLKEWGWID
ncbi:MAG: hypothetical protein ABFS12_09195 [Bacteroidota bacterium]